MTEKPMRSVLVTTVNKVSNTLQRHITLLLAVLTMSTSSCSLFKSATRTGLSYQEEKVFQEYYFQASKEKVLGNTALALQQFNKALEVDPNSHATLYQIANLHYALHDIDKAIYFAERSVEKSTEYNFWYYGQLGQFYNRKGMYTESAEVFYKMAKSEPDRRTNYMEAANQYINAMEFKKSLEVLEEYRERFGIDEESARKLEGIYGELGKIDKANEVMEDLVNANPGDSRYLGLLAESYLRAKRADDAKGTYEKMLELDAGNGYAHFGLADIYRSKVQDELAFSHMLDAFRDDDVSVGLKLQVIQSYFPFITSNPDMRDQALQLLGVMEEVHSQDPRVFVAHCDVLYSARQPRQARAKLRISLDLDPSNFSGWQQLIALDSELGDFEEMQKDSKEFLDNFPIQPLPYISNAHANMLLGYFEQAIHVAQEGLEISRLKEDKSQLLITLATSFYEIGKYEESDNAHEELLELAPNDDLALNNYAYFLAQRGEKLDKAQQMIEKALQRAPNNISYLDTYGWVLYQLEKYEEALVYLKRAHDADPNDPEILQHLGSVYVKLERTQEAEAIFKKLEEINKEIQSRI